MQYAVILFIVIIVILVISQNSKRFVETKKAPKDYMYTSKSAIMTKTELNFYNKLSSIMGEKYYIVPQAHLSTFLDHKIKKQNWRGAFAIINGKSVDFLICNKENSRPIIAIELDDWTHGREDRLARDELVNRIINESGILLVRFREGEWDTPANILEKISSQRTNKPFITA